MELNKYIKLSMLIISVVTAMLITTTRVGASDLSDLKKQYSIETSDEKIINVKDEGVTGDGKTDDTKALQAVLDQIDGDKKSVIYLPEGEYMIKTNDSPSSKEMVQRFVNTDVGLHVKSNTTILMDEKAYLKAIPNEFYSYTVLNLKDASHVNIYGGNIVGDRDEHIDKYSKLRRGDPEYNGETGWGILMVSSQNIVIDSIRISNMWGDGIDLFSTKEATRPNQQIVIKNSTLSNNRRQGISVENVNGLVVTNTLIENTKGTDPSAGINIEPADFKNHSLRSAKNITLTQNHFLNNDDAGVLMYGMGEKIFYDKDESGHQQRAIIDNVKVLDNIFEGNNTNHQNVQDGAWFGAFNGQLMIVGATNVLVKDNKLINPRPLGSMDNGNTKARFEANSYPEAGILIGYSENITIEHNNMPKQNISILNQWSQPGTFAYPNSVGIVVENNTLNDVIKAGEGKNMPEVKEENNGANVTQKTLTFWERIKETMSDLFR